MPGAPAPGIYFLANSSKIKSIRQCRMDFTIQFIFQKNTLHFHDSHRFTRFTIHHEANEINTTVSQFFTE